MNNPLTGQVLDGYQVGPLLGVGGMGEVYQATDTRTGQPVAIKFLRDDHARDPEVQARFIREIRIMESLVHPNIVPIYRFGIIRGELLYYSMRLIQGLSLSTLFKRQRFTPLSYWEILEPVAAALEFGHQHNVIHRDVKPDNIFVERDESGQAHVFLGDFGLGKRKGTDVTLTEADAIIGTPHYMSPEGIMGERHDPRSDVYSLAVVTYEALLGIVPFNESHAHKTAIAHVTKQPPAPTSINPDFPPVLEQLLLKGLAKVPDARQQSIAEFAQSYRQALASMTPEQRIQPY